MYNLERDGIAMPKSLMFPNLLVLVAIRWYMLGQI